jgi:hypothetical protein
MRAGTACATTVIIMHNDIAIVQLYYTSTVYERVVEKVYFLGLFKNARMQGTRNPEE